MNKRRGKPVAVLFGDEVFGKSGADVKTIHVG